MTAKRRFLLAWLAIGLLGSGVPHFGQTARIGNEFQVNTYTTSYQERPQVARNSAGSFVVVWQSYGRDGSNSGVVGQLYDNSGTKFGNEISINTYTTGSQLLPSVSMSPSADFVVVWQSALEDGQQDGVYGRRFNGSGAPLAGEFRANTYTTNEQSDPSVDYDGSGNFVVAWGSSCGTTYPCTGQDGAYSGVFGQRYSSNGSTAGNEFRANTYTRDDQGYPVVSRADNGKFVVVWTSYQEGSGMGPFSYGIYGQVYTKDGVKSGNEFHVNAFTARSQSTPAVSVNGPGAFVVTWESYGQFGFGGYDVIAQRYNSSNAKVGSEFRVNTYTTDDQMDAAVAMDPTGKFVVVWRSRLEDGSASGIYGQRYNADGTAHGIEFRVNTYTTSDQRQPSIAMDGSGNFVVVWTSVGEDGSSTGVFGQKFSAADCQALTVPTPANQTSCAGGTAFFTVSPSGLGPFTYQWQKNGVNVTDGAKYAGAHNPVLKIKQVVAGDAGSYRCIVGDWCLPSASTTSSAGTLTVAGGVSAGQVSNLKVQKINSGTSLKLTWNNTTNATDYVVFEDPAYSGPFTTQTGTSASGVTGLTIAMPSGNRDYTVAGRNAACGVGPQ